MALLATLVATLLLTGLGVALVLLGSAATTLAAHDQLVSDAEYGADGALRLAVSELRERPEWTSLLLPGGTTDVSGAPGRLTDTSLFPRVPWDGSTLDLHALTQQLQASTDAATAAGVVPPLWRLFEYGPISRLIPSEPRHPLYVAVWAADGRDGLLLLRAAALGPRGVQASVEASLAHDSAGATVRLSIRTPR